MATTNEGTQRDELAQIKARAEAATPGPWKEDTKVRGDVVVWGPNGRFLMNLQAETHWIDYPDEKRSVAFDVDARDATFIANARTDVPKLVAALEAVLVLAEQWRYKGEFGWGAWQEGHGPDPEGTVLDDASAALRGAILGAFE